MSLGRQPGAGGRGRGAAQQAGAVSCLGQGSRQRGKGRSQKQEALTAEYKGKASISGRASCMELAAALVMEAAGGALQTGSRRLS